MRNKITTDYILEMLKEVKSLCDTNAFNNTKLDFVDLSLRDSIDLNSIQFRVVFPASPQSVLKVQNLSFNLYIQEPPSL